MPLIHSKSDKAVGKNIAREEAAGKPHDQAVAIALNTQRSAGRAEAGSNHDDGAGAAPGFDMSRLEKDEENDNWERESVHEDAFMNEEQRISYHEGRKDTMTDEEREQFHIGRQDMAQRSQTQVQPNGMQSEDKDADSSWDGARNYSGPHNG